MTARVLLLSTYPVVEPAHGGQKRTLAIALAYRAAGFEVVQSAVFCQAYYPSASMTDIPVSVDFETRIRRDQFRADVLCGQAMTEDPPVRRELEKLLRVFDPDVVHVEQPYLYPGLRTLLGREGKSPAVVYGSQNIEAPMKRGILTDAGWEPGEVEAYCQRIHRLEATFSRECDLLAACTEDDLAEHLRYGAMRGVLAKNGVERVRQAPNGSGHPTVEGLAADRKVVFFVASAHRPNLVGYRDLVGVNVDFLPSDAELVVAGGIGNSLRHNLGIGTPSAQGRQPLLAGRVEEAQLQGLLGRAEVILLPITSGGGSNLKTAEALAVDTKLVSTSTALRSFEWARDLPNVWVADSAEDFRAAIASALAAPRVPRTPDQEEAVSAVYWDRCLQELVAEVELLARTRSGSSGAL